jgi:predicted nucleic acid-binding protein
VDGPGTLARHRVVGIDTVVWIYALEHHPDFGEGAAAVLAAVEAGEIAGVISTLVLAELLVGPFRSGGATLADRYAERLTTFPHLRVVAPDAAVCRVAARLRAGAPALRLPDAIHLATCLTAGATAFVTNDARVRPVDGLEVVQLRDRLP